MQGQLALVHTAEVRHVIVDASPVAQALRVGRGKVGGGGVGAG